MCSTRHHAVPRAAVADAGLFPRNYHPGLRSGTWRRCIRRAFPAQRSGQAAVEDVCMIWGRMDRRDVWRVFEVSTIRCRSACKRRRVCRTGMGARNIPQRALDIRHVRRLLPETAFVAFPDCAHAEFSRRAAGGFCRGWPRRSSVDGSDI